MFNGTFTTLAFHYGEQIVTKKLQSVILEGWEKVWLVQSVILD